MVMCCFKMIPQEKVWRVNKVIYWPASLLITCNSFTDLWHAVMHTKNSTTKSPPVDRCRDDISYNQWVNACRWIWSCGGTWRMAGNVASTQSYMMYAWALIAPMYKITSQKTKTSSCSRDCITILMPQQTLTLAPIASPHLLFLGSKPTYLSTR